MADNAMTVRLDKKYQIVIRQYNFNDVFAVYRKTFDREPTEGDKLMFALEVAAGPQGRFEKRLSIEEYWHVVIVE